MGVPNLLSDEEIAERLVGLPGWERMGDAITRTYKIRYHASVAAIVTIADRSRRIQHHADLPRVATRPEGALLTGRPGPEGR